MKASYKNGVFTMQIDGYAVELYKATFKDGVFIFEIDGYAVELYKENEIWLDKVHTLFGHVINRVSSEKSIKFTEVVEAIKADIREAKQIETTIFK